MEDGILKCEKWPQYIKIDNSIINYYYDCPQEHNCQDLSNWNNITLIDNTIYDVCTENWITNPCDKPLLNKGLMYDWGWSDQLTGGMCIGFSIMILCICLYLIVKILQKLIKGRAARLLKKALNFNGYFSILIGCLVTILVQSSSITTSTLIPLCAVGLINLEQMYPLTLGANIGTTITGLLAATVAISNPQEALQAALAHLFFNIIGILIWYPIPKLRQIPLNGARWLGKQTNKYKWFPIIYIVIVFFAIPGICYGITAAISN